MQWPAFWDSFKSSVHDNDALSSVDKFNYLQSLLKGPASKAIQGLPRTEGNYNDAVELLKARFDNTRVIIAALMDELVKLPDCSQDRHTSLRSIYDKITIHTRGLSSLGINLSEYGSLLIPILMPKLPEDMCLRIARAHPGEVWKMEDILTTIRIKVEAREASSLSKVTAPRNTSSKPVNPAASSLVANGQLPKCVYCQGEHYSASCTVVKTAKDQRSTLIQGGRCFICLRTHHRAKDCDVHKKCRHCNGRHHQSLCEKARPVDEQPPVDKPATETTSNNCNNSKCDQLVLLQTARALASDEGTGRAVAARILFDTGSQRSYITDNLANRLRLKSLGKERLHLNTFGDHNFRRKTCNVVAVHLRKLNGTEGVTIQALSFPTICLTLPSLVKLNDFPGLCELDLDLADPPSSGPEAIDILIGSDWYWNIVGGEVIRTQGGPTAVCSKLGWLLSGTVSSDTSLHHVSSNLVLCQGVTVFSPPEPVDHLRTALESFWETETIGIKEPSDSECAGGLFLKDVKFTNNRYEVSLPWNRDRLEVPDHFDLCKNRLKYLQRRLKSRPTVMLEYHRIIKDQLRNGILEPVSKENEADKATVGCAHYMPHHPVIRQDKSTTKIRIVYDGSATSKDGVLSLNDCLQVGPNLIPKLFNVLIQFRCHPIALVGDIEKAFLMISIKDLDRDMLRFLWLKEPFNEHSDIIQLRFTRLVFGLKPSPAILGAVLAHHIQAFQATYPKTVDTMGQSLYVDDLVAGGSDVVEVFELYQNAKAIMA